MLLDFYFILFGVCFIIYKAVRPMILLWKAQTEETSQTEEIESQYNITLQKYLENYFFNRNKKLSNGSSVDRYLYRLHTSLPRDDEGNIRTDVFNYIDCDDPTYKECYMKLAEKLKTDYKILKVIESRYDEHSIYIRQKSDVEILNLITDVVKAGLATNGFVYSSRESMLPYYIRKHEKSIQRYLNEKEEKKKEKEKEIKELNRKNL